MQKIKHKRIDLFNNSEIKLEQKKLTALDIFIFCPIIFNMNIRTIYLDLDNVLANVEAHSSRSTTWTYWELLSTEEQRNTQSHLMHNEEHFFQQVPPYEYAQQLYKFCKKFTLNVRFLSCFTPKTDAEFARITRDKQTWVRKYIDPRIADSDIIIVRESKQQYANSSSLLIDDNPKNIQKWKEHHGIGITFKGIDNCVHQMRALPELNQYIHHTLAYRNLSRSH